MSTKIARMTMGACAVGGILAGMLAMPAAANASTPTLDAAGTAKLEAFWSEYSVPEATQARLLEGVNDGKMMVSDLQSEEPITSKTIERVTDTAVVSTYSDGSISVTTQQKPVVWAPKPGTVTTQGSSITGCSVTSGSGFRGFANCKVQGNSGLIGFGYYLSYTLVQGGNDYIRESYGATTQCVYPAACDQPFKDRQKLKEDAAGNAGVSYGMHASLGTTVTYYLTTNVGHDAASSKFG
jgi:hypothetical protein